MNTRVDSGPPQPTDVSGCAPPPERQVPSESYVPADVARALRGEREGWDELVNRYTPLLWATARSHRLNHQDAADAVQVTWLRCVEQLHRIREPTRLVGWLITVCHRECLLILRTTARCHPFDGTDPSGPLGGLRDEKDTADPAHTAVARDEATAVREAISRLPEQQRRLLTALLNAAAFSGHGYSEIAGALNIPVGSIGPTRQRALGRLRRDPRLHGLQPQANP